MNRFLDSLSPSELMAVWIEAPKSYIDEVREILSGLIKSKRVLSDDQLTMLAFGKCEYIATLHNSELSLLELLGSQRAVVPKLCAFYECESSSMKMLFLGPADDWLKHISSRISSGECLACLDPGLEWALHVNSYGECYFGRLREPGWYEVRTPAKFYRSLSGFKIWSETDAHHGSCRLTSRISEMRKWTSFDPGDIEGLLSWLVCDDEERKWLAAVISAGIPDSSMELFPLLQNAALSGYAHPWAILNLFVYGQSAMPTLEYIASSQDKEHSRTALATMRAVHRSTAQK